MRRALAFLTPFGPAAPPNPATLAWFPAVGVLIGLAIGAIWWLSAQAWPPLAAAAVAVVADLALTGLLHFDGLADAADGLLAPLTRERRLQAMADPAIGAFGAISVGAVLLLRFGALASLRPVPLVLGGLWCASRASMVVMTQTLPYARPGGLVEAFVGARRGPPPDGLYGWAR
jgi:adenosylcobinamide-GDP ribazoletransferase